MPSVPRLIPDINVLLSGLTSRVGPARELYVAAQRFDVILVLAEEHFGELQRVLTYPQVLAIGGCISPSDAFGLATDLHRIAEMVSPLRRQDWPSCADMQDWYLLDLLMTSGADAIVSKNGHLLQVKKDFGIPVYEPKQLKRLRMI